MGVDSGIYKFTLVLHLITVVIGFGATFWASFYGMQAKARRGREGLAIAEASFDIVERMASWFIYAVPILGILLVLFSEDTWQFSEAWISLSFLIYIVAIGLVHGLHVPNLRRMNVLMAELAAGPPAGGAAGGPPAQAVELEQRGKRAAMIGGLLNAAWVLILVLMVFKPGR
jgi:uncharacterized membrane protein